jgi:L-rhamnose mutarotase
MQPAATPSQPPARPSVQLPVRYALALDLVDKAEKIAAYEKAHAAIWPQVRDHLRGHGVLDMEIYRLGTRLFMLMEVDPQVYRSETMAAAALANPLIVQWEALMGRYQLPTPWSAADEKWTPMARIFSLRGSY